MGVIVVLAIRFTNFFPNGEERGWGGGEGGGGILSSSRTAAHCKVVVVNYRSTLPHMTMFSILNIAVYSCDTD